MIIDYRWFDLWYKTDTSTTETTDDNYIVSIDSENINKAVDSTGDKLTRFYSAMSTIKFHLNASGVKIQDLNFIDYGCGKGRVLILAKKYGIKKVSGVELSSSMIDIAKFNLNIVNIDDVELIEQDASIYDIPSAKNYIFYFYNPFDSFVFNKVLEKIKSCSSSNKYIVYSNPIHHELFNRNNFELIKESHKLMVFRSR